jgi:hypothetical protein
LKENAPELLDFAMMIDVLQHQVYQFKLLEHESSSGHKHARLRYYKRDGW